jgi:hypothetical protein
MLSSHYRAIKVQKEAVPGKRQISTLPTLTLANPDPNQDRHTLSRPARRPFASDQSCARIIRPFDASHAALSGRVNDDLASSLHQPMEPHGDGDRPAWRDNTGKHQKES